MSALAPIESPRGPVCGIYAAALAANVPFHQSMAAAKLVVRKARHSAWKGRMYGDELKQLMKTLGVATVELEGYADQTLASAAKQLGTEAHYVIFITGHFLTLHNGLVYDQSHKTGTPVETYEWRRRHVNFILRKEQQ